ncbi:MAG: Asp-tRNA(Asn)/Glu-tRNA(Gln) amidotransferase subunit GatA, partial [Clostridiales bacterium]|nr:Asp-tRNA(Asn)/Glu-tRNA(Gln) amidotransferase subunit GatA [Clostridiales bacterium]
AGFAPLAIGSDTGGSIRQPAAFCGNVGLKPTYGLVSRFGLIAFASSLDQIGTFTKTVKDAAEALETIQGHDHLDSTSAAGGYEMDYKAYLDKGIKGMKYGLPREFMQEGIDEEVKASIMASIDRITKLGGEVEEFSLPITDTGLSAYYIISSAEASSNLARYDGIRYGYRSKNYENIDELMQNSRTEAFGDEVKRRIMIGTYVLSSGYYDAYYKKALLFRNKLKNTFNEAFEKYDAIISPVSPVLPFDIGERTDNPIHMYLADIYTINVNIAGLPAISIPCGYSRSNLPIGIQFIGKAYKENTLFQAAYALEQDLGIYARIPELKEAL